MPLADILRPKTLDDIIGQEHLVGKDGIITKMVEKSAVKSIILWGPPGLGKTTIARCLAHDSAYAFEELNATNAKIADIRKTISTAEARKKSGTSTIILVDECHRMTKVLQDALLPYVENGVITLVAATTEKAQFALSNALLSRIQAYELHPLRLNDMIKIFMVVKKHLDVDIKISKKTLMKLINKCSGDARKLISVLETITDVLIESDGTITDDMIDVVMPHKHLYIDKSEHFDYAMNLQTAIQNSDVNSAVYWLAKWSISGGQSEIPSIARRILVCASEDACENPNAAMVANNAYIAAKEIGYPECMIILSHAVIEIANSKRCRIANDAIHNAINDVENGVDVYAEHTGSSTYTKIDKAYVENQT